ncbi:spermidine/putrescine ABC transporter permease [Sphingopyxis bauzanensis]|uniref:Spermidine/putrescine ABC transporter permease n=1 Tax=Sphingopyxis bauzanensis TaxID=651663 RepID=A0A246JUY6_9SPHN|nr:ABC transporter permease [Sphingopyxis bauzanensis]OWQ96904.1 spermidine/putrescine ABC transporter permease [Sphingopyxis bauzanensis]GGJ43134.1 spermidine/putrescine ABC transporter permease [Sphingopyxis bauzanensis]
MAEQDWKTSKRTFAAVSLPTLLWVVVFFLVPMAIVWLYSFGENRGLTEIEFSGTLDNYKRATEWLYLGIFGKSFAVAALVTLICLIIGFPVAMAITFASEKWRPWLLLGIMLPFWTNLLIRTYALMMLLGTQGFANKGMGALWEGTSWIKTLVGLQPLPTWEPVQLLFNNFAVVFGLVYVHLPFMVLPLYAALDRLDRSLIEASLDLGAGHFRTIMRIVVPLAAPGIIAGVMITLIPALGAYLTPDLMGGTDSQMIANVIERQFKKANDWPFGAALSFLLIYAMFALIAIQSMHKKVPEVR